MDDDIVVSDESAGVWGSVLVEAIGVMIALAVGVLFEAIGVMIALAVGVLVEAIGVMIALAVGVLVEMRRSF